MKTNIYVNIRLLGWIYSIIADRVGESFRARILQHCDLSPGTNVHEFQSERHAIDNLKHLLSSNTCICSNIYEKCRLTSQTVVHSKQNSPPITLFVWDNNILWMKIWRVTELVLPYQSKLTCFFFPCQSSKNWMNTLVILVNTTLVCHNFALTSTVKFCVLQNMYLNMKTMFKLFMSENCLITKY